MRLLLGLPEGAEAVLRSRRYVLDGKPVLLSQPEEAERLAIAPGTPVVDICRVALAADGTPVEVNEMTAESSAFVFRYEFDRP